MGKEPENKDEKLSAYTLSALEDLRQQRREALASNPNSLYSSLDQLEQLDLLQKPAKGPIPNRGLPTLPQGSNSNPILRPFMDTFTPKWTFERKVSEYVYERIKFSLHEDRLLTLGVARFGRLSWDQIVKFYVPTKTSAQLRNRFKNRTCNRAGQNPIKAHFSACPPPSRKKAESLALAAFNQIQRTKRRLEDDELENSTLQDPNSDDNGGDADDFEKEQLSAEDSDSEQFEMDVLTETSDNDEFEKESLSSEEELPLALSLAPASASRVVSVPSMHHFALTPLPSIPSTSSRPIPVFLSSSSSPAPVRASVLVPLVPPSSVQAALTPSAPSASSIRMLSDNIMVIEGREVKWTKEQDKMVLIAGKDSQDYPDSSEVWERLTTRNPSWKRSVEEISARYLWLMQQMRDRRVK